MIMTPEVAAWLDCLPEGHKKTLLRLGAARLAALNVDEVGQQWMMTAHNEITHSLATGPMVSGLWWAMVVLVKCGEPT